ncbi:MAG: UDP-N-acetylmuramate:L-alanyl-gamma-D-glutamyl-meso-diaminopimelate ligase [Acidobacteria bacterium]|nr:UDP-N-acetylmuramate:L-alanyl-gamma-D-glutamyl-meso-diaminopimelate ligase [Acidobacteriota bacterium]
MATLAGLLHQQGHQVEGVDTELYPPMSTLLDDLGIPVRLGWNPELIPAADRVIIGNAVPRTNPEVQRVLIDRRPILSQAETVSHYLLAEGRESLVVAGTHGKTTTTSLLAWVFEELGTDPTTLVGGLLKWSRRSFRLGRGQWMIIEGDEYNTAFFDRGPKFLHYRARIFLLGPVEFDHADLYRDLDAVLTAFRAGTAQVPRHGTVVVNALSPAALEGVRDTSAEVIKVGTAPDCALRLGETLVEGDSAITSTPLAWQGRSLNLRLPMPGRHNAENAAMAVAGALAAELDPDAILDALSRFPGVARRMDTIGEASDILVVDDFAHHPTALAVTIDAARSRWPHRRLVIAYEPRSLTAARRAFQDRYVEALSNADVALVAPPFHSKRLGPEECLDRERMASELKSRGVQPLMPPEGEDLVEALVPSLRPGDVVIGCSSGDFGTFHRRLLERLGWKEN